MSHDELVSTIEIDDRVVLICPECQEPMPVSLRVSVFDDYDTGWRIATEHSLADVWTHMWVHGGA